MANDLETLTKANARSAGLKKFFSGKPCRNGHFGLSWLSGSGCCVCWSGRTKKYRAENKSLLAVRDAERYRETREARLVQVSQYRKANKEQVRQAIRSHYYANRPAYHAHSAKRRAAKLRAMPPWVDLEALAAVYAQAASAARNTGIEHDVDHIVPLRGCCVSGLHVPWNLQVLTASENRAKGNRWGCQVCGKG